MRQEGEMPKLTVAPRIRSFICLNAHPVGCAANVEREIAVATQGAPGSGLKHVLVIGASTGYGLSSLVTGVFGYGARGTAICLERAAHGERTASAGYYNLAAAQRLARARGKQIVVINGDAFSEAVKQETLARVAASGVKLDCVVYSLAAPKRTDEKAGVTYNSALKPIGAPFSSQTINLGNDQIQQVDIPPATDAEIEATRKVMGGEDFADWVHALLDADLLAKGCRVVAYSYIGPELTTPIYRSGTIGKAKEDLETRTAELSAALRERVGGGAWVSVNKALVTQASAAIPVVPLYISALYRVMKEAGTHEGTAEQIARLFRDHLGPGSTPTTDAGGRIRIDDREMDPAVQARVSEMWKTVTSETLMSAIDYAGFKHDFRVLFGFEVPGVNYDEPVETEVPIAE
jgi:enoyl-[acyl-carrier protein] reductase / trans-2-enoyl-CoA reductase (NAD+)